MRLLLIAFVTFSVGAGATCVQAAPGSPPVNPATLTKAELPTLRLLPSATPPMVISPHRAPPGVPQSRQKNYDRDVADCMQMWDSGTHMTKLQWASTCKRVQTRLDNLNVDAMMPKTMTRVR
jgi:hypothetical protein